MFGYLEELHPFSKKAEELEELTGRCKSCLGTGKTFHLSYKDMEVETKGDFVEQICNRCEGKGFVNL
jgi:hypothetical protein